MANLQTDVLLRSEETGGHVSVTEIVVPPGTAGPPLHTHDFDEAFYMLEGELIFQVEDALVVKGPGELSFAPRNAAHALANHSDAPARYLLVCTPAGFERHWARSAAEAAGVEPPQWALQPIPEVTVVGPQIPSGDRSATFRMIGRRAARPAGAPGDRDCIHEEGLSLMHAWGIAKDVHSDPVIGGLGHVGHTDLPVLAGCRFDGCTGEADIVIAPLRRRFTK